MNRLAKGVYVGSESFWVVIGKPEGAGAEKGSSRASDDTRGLKSLHFEDFMRPDPLLKSPVVSRLRYTNPHSGTSGVRELKIPKTHEQILLA